MKEPSGRRGHSYPPPLFLLLPILTREGLVGMLALASTSSFNFMRSLLLEVCPKIFSSSV